MLGLCDPEIDELRDAGVGDEDVLWGDISMDELEVLAGIVPLLVGGVKTCGSLGDDVNRHRQRNRSAYLAHGAEQSCGALPFDVLHGEEELVLLGAKLDNLNDVGMAYKRKRACFISKHRAKRLFLRKLRANALDDDRCGDALGALENAEKHLAHSTLSQSSHDAVASYPSGARASVRQALKRIVKLIIRAILASFVIAAAGTQWLLPREVHAQDDERRVSLRLYNEAAEDYEAGRFDDAADKLETAHRLFPEPILLYNLGRALEGGGDNEGALDAYREFLEVADEDAEERPMTQERIEVVEDLIAEENRANEEREARQAREAQEASERQLQAELAAAPPANVPGYGTPIAFAVSAALVAGAGVPLQLRAQSLNDEAAEPATSQARASELNAQARRNAYGGIGLFAAGGVLAVVSVALFVVRKNQRAEVSLAPTGASLRVRF